MPRISLLTSRASIGRFRNIATAVANFNFAPTIATNVQNYNLNSDAIANGWDGVTAITANVLVNSNVYVWSDSTATAAFVVGTLPAGSVVNITNNGFIMGRGGDGGNVTAANQSTIAGQSGGPAININYNITITNNSYIAGGGGGADGWSGSIDGVGGGGGAGGGTGGAGKQSTTFYLGTVGGAPGSTAATASNVGNATGGGRILPGSTANQAGGRGGSVYRQKQASPPRGDVAGSGGGGGWGATGGNVFLQSLYAPTAYYGAGGLTNNPGQNGGGPPTYSGTTFGGGSGTGGKAINLNGFTATFAVTGTVYGAVS